MAVTTIYTYGGGEILRMIFNSIAILTSGGIFKSMMVIFASCGAFWVVTSSFFSGKVEAILLRFFLPALTITALLMLPKSTVYIEDPYAKAPLKVDNVPWLLAFPVQTISSIGYKITDSVESIMHVPKDVQYNKTGMVFGSETALDMKKFTISNPILEQNLKRFSKQCVFYDLALKKYTLNDLKKSGDIWKFLAENTSKVRMIPYTDPTTPTSKTVRYLNCKAAVAEMTPIFEKEKNYYAMQDIGKHLPMTFQALTGLQKNQKELISQQLTMNYLDRELGSENFAKSRAYMQQKSTYHILGSLASSSLVTMRVILEAMIYASVIFIIPLSVLPGGLKYIANWLWMLIWIQLWPPFYAIANYVLQIIAQQKAAVIFSSFKDVEPSLSFFTNAGLANLYEDLFAMSGYLMTMIPFLSYAIVKGGISSIIHMAGSLMGPSQSAAGAAATEQVSGNYSFGSSTFGQMNYENATTMQQNLSPSISSGHFTENSGGMTTQYTSEGVFLNQNNSRFRFDASSDKAITQSLQNAYQEAESFSETKQKSYSESLSAHGRWMSDFTEHLSTAENFTSGTSSREAIDVQESARYASSKVQSLAQQHGISESDAWQLTLGGSLLIGGVCKQSSDSESTLYTDALNLSNSEDFQKSIQNITDFAKTSSHNALTDEGIRLSDGISKSLDEVRSSQEQYSAALHRSEQLSETISFAENNSHVFRESLNQGMFDWATKQFGFEEAKRVLTEGSYREKIEVFNEFLKDVAENNFSSIIEGHSIRSTYENSQVTSIDKDVELDKMYADTLDLASANGLNKGSVGESRDELESGFDRFLNDHESQTGNLNSNDAFSDIQNSERYKTIQSRIGAFKGAEEGAKDALSSLGSAIQNSDGSLAWNTFND